ncbi:MAG: hypothetical protein JF599_09790 [Verrucomicrobia bacterium]|nr:hypothetical protein [Verrucomicrobiota bacterium]
MRTLAVFLFLTTLVTAEPRTWTSADGRTIKAELVSVKDGKITLRRSDNQTFILDKATLSANDSDFIDKWKGRPLRPITISTKIEMVQLDQKNTSWKTDYGSYAKDALFMRGLSVMAKTIDDGANPDVIIKFAFTGIDQETKSMVIYDCGMAPFQVLRGDGYSDIFFSEVQTNSDTNYSALGERYRDGIKPNGWAVFLEQDGKEIYATASTTETLNAVRIIIKNDSLEFKPYVRIKDRKKD